MTRPSAKGSPAQQRQQDLRAELSSIRQQQQQLKSSKGNLHEKIKQLDISVKSRMNEQKNARSRMPFKTVDEIDQRIQQLDKQVDTGTMKLVDEKKALGEISSLRKQRKGFAQFDEAQRGIDDEKAQLNELRKGLDDPEAKALSERYTAVAKELDDLRAEQDEAFKGINTLRDEKSKLHSEQQERYMAIRAIKDAYYSQKKAYTEYEHEAYKARKERQKAQRDAHEKERRKKIADQRLEEASQPAFLDEILTAEGLVRYFDPSAAAAAAATATGSSSSMSASGGSSKLAAQPSRTVDGPDFKGVKVIKKDDREENYFVGGGGKKGKKGRRNQQGGGTASPGGTSSPPDAGTATPTTTTTGTESTGGKFHLTIGIIEELSRIDLEPPMGPADVPAVVEKLKQKLEKWKKEQDAQTKAVCDVDNLYPFIFLLSLSNLTSPFNLTPNLASSLSPISPPLYSQSHLLSIPNLASSLFPISPPLYPQSRLLAIPNLASSLSSISPPLYPQSRLLFIPNLTSSLSPISPPRYPQSRLLFIPNLTSSPLLSVVFLPGQVGPRCS